MCNVRDRASAKSPSDSSSTLLRDILDEYLLTDVADMHVDREELRFTHFQQSSHARLDRIYVSAELGPITVAYSVKPVFFSDHCLVGVTVGKKSKSSRKFSWGLWKFNVNLLKDKSFTDGVINILDKLGENRYLSFTEKWELFKEEVKLLAIEKSSIANYVSKKEENGLQQCLLALLKDDSECPGRYAEEIKVVKRELQRFQNNRYRGAVVRARAEKFLLGEQPTKRALADERCFALAKEITALDHEGVICKDKDGIQRAFVAHYTNLFGDKGEPKETAALKGLLQIAPELSTETKDWMEQPITKSEIDRAIESHAAHKTPGPDGLCAELYQHFRDQLSVFLFEVIREAYRRQALPPSFLQSHMILIPKSKDEAQRRKVSSYRPIALSNVDYKIFAKVLARRLQHIICQLVGDHQTCGIKGRAIQTNIHVARTILENSPAEGSQIAMIHIDLEKAFDRVCHRVLWEVLNKANVGNIVFEGVKMAYSGCTTRLVINNSLSEKINVLSSVRQGCPMSSLLFCLYLEPLCLSVIRSEHVEGYTMGNVEVKVLAYADDVAFFCQDKTSISKVLDLCKIFCDATGASINKNKCLGIWYGQGGDAPVCF